MVKCEHYPDDPSDPYAIRTGDDPERVRQHGPIDVGDAEKLTALVTKKIDDLADQLENAEEETRLYREQVVNRLKKIATYANGVRWAAFIVAAILLIIFLARYFP